MTFLEIVEQCYIIAGPIVEGTETKIDDMVREILWSLAKKFGPAIFSGEGEAASPYDNLPAEALPEVEKLAARIESN